METKGEAHVWVGVDVSKETFFAAVDVLDENGGKGLVNRLFSIVMESTGCYSKKLKGFLHEKQNDLPIRILNGRQGSNYGKSLGTLHKTDKSDARALARFGTERSPKPALSDDPVRESPKELSRERSAPLKAKAARENRSDSLFAAFTKDINNRAIVALNLQISAIEKEMERGIKANAELRHEAELMKTVPGVGLTSASGLLPRVFISGTSVNKTCLSKRGSSRVRQLRDPDCMTAVDKIPKFGFTGKHKNDSQVRLHEKTAVDHTGGRRRRSPV